MTFESAAGKLRAHIDALAGIDRLRRLRADGASEPDMLGEILGAAAKFSAEVLQPFDRQADRAGCRLENGRVLTANGHAETWQAFSELGWNGIESSQDYGGMGLPLVVHCACEELFNRGSLAFGMLATSSRCSVKLLQQYAPAAIRDEWLPRLVSGTWGATICISEPGAGSDVGRVRTMASPQPDGSWRIEGEKCWISYGDHDLTDRIGHVLLARTPGSRPGTAGLSLFLVPSTIAGNRNAITVRRLEEKLGLHASPTCALGFEGATGYLIGEPHRGLAQLFAMIGRMRISVGSQGAAIAAACTDLATAYAAERRQGGPPDMPPPPIDRHPDVRRMLLEMAARTEVTRGLVLATAIAADLAEQETADADKARWTALLGWLLPVTKTFGAETAFEVSSAAIQVLGGAGYTREWPAEQHLRDARILSIYEGTSGMQALDLVERRLVGDRRKGLDAFFAIAAADSRNAGGTEAAAALDTMLGLLADASSQVESMEREDAGAIAYHYLQLAGLAATAWIALRLADLAGNRVNDHLAACGRHWLRLAPARARREAAVIASGDGLLAEWQALDRG